MKKSTIFLTLGLTVGVTALATAGGIFLVSYLSKEPSVIDSTYFYNVSLKEILKATVKDKYKNLQPTAFLATPKSIDNYIDFQLEPNVKLEYLQSKYNLNFQIINSSVDNFTGTLQVKVWGFDKKNKEEDEQIIITVSGFKKTDNLTSNESIWFTNEIGKIKNLSFKKNVTSLNANNFWDSIVLPDSLELYQGFYVPKDAKNKESYEYSVKVEGYHENSYFVKLSLTYRRFPNKKITKLFLINDEFNQSPWKQKLDSNFAKFVLPGNVNQMNQEELKTHFFQNANDSSFIEVFREMSNNNDGYVYLKRKSLDGIISFAKYKLTDYNTLFTEMYNNKDSQIKTFINTELNVANNKESVFEQYNAPDAFNFRYSRLTDFVNKKMQARSDYLQKILKISDTMQIYDFENFQNASNNAGIFFDVVNVSGQSHIVYLPFSSPTPYQNFEFNTLGLPIKSIQELEKEIQRRTMAISFFEKKEVDGEEKDFVISGTAWVLDKSKTEKNTYFLATNSHVVEKMQSNWKNIEVFQYTLYNDVDDFSIKNLNIFGNVASKDLRRGIPTNFENINTFPELQKQKYRDLWKTFEIYNLGKNAFGQNASADIAIIKIRFPEDDFDKNGVLIKKYTPDAVHYYNEMQQKNETKLKFFTSDALEWNEKNNFKSNESDFSIRKTILPTDLTLGGFLGGYKWISNSGSAFLYYSTINKTTEISFYDNFKEPDGPSVTSSQRNPYQIIIPMSRAGKGMSGSMVLDRFGRIVGIFWGGSFGTQETNDNSIEKGIANLEPLGISINGNKSIIQHWLDITKDQITDLDDIANEITN